MSRFILKTLSKFRKKVKIVFWSDSEIALQWICSAKSTDIFVKNRVKEISTSTQPTDWHYCSTKENPADLLTRGLAIGSMVKNEFWNSGPDWLKRKADVWITSDSLRTKEVDKIYEAANRR